jgi:hypothetical protein
LARALFVDVVVNVCSLVVLFLALSVRYAAELAPVAGMWTGFFDGFDGKV